MRKSRIAAVVLVLALLALAWRFGLFAELTDPARAKAMFVALGPWGYVAFVLAYALLQPFGVPGTVFIFAAPLLWPWPVAFALSMIGTMAASVVGFSFARFVSRDWIASKIPPRIKSYDERLGSNAFSTVFFLRLILWMPPWLHAFFGISKVRFVTHFWASLAGYALPLFLVSFFGQRLVDMMLTATPRLWVAMIAGTLAFVAAAFFARRAWERRSSATVTT